MNTKRQTVWLISMLGLMVVLSAYYLFTDDVDRTPVASEQTDVGQIEVSGVQTTDPAIPERQLTLDDITAIEGSETAATRKNTVNEQQMLDQLAAIQRGDAAITTMQMTRNADFSRQLEDLTNSMTAAGATEAQIAEAINKHDELLDLESKLIAFEEKLLGDYQNVVVMYDQSKDHYTVNVHATELERSEAVSIIRQALTDFDIAIHQVSVRLFR